MNSINARAAGFGIHVESPCLLGNDPVFGKLNLMHGCLVSQGAATAVRNRWPLGQPEMQHDDERYRRIRQHHAEYERRGGWARPFVNVSFYLTVALLSALSVIWYDGIHDFGEFAGVFQFVTAFFIGCLTLCVALTCLAVTLMKYSKLGMTQRILGIVPIGLFGLVSVAAFLQITPFR